MEWMIQAIGTKYKEQAPSFDNPITLNLLDSAVTDSISNTEIIYDYNDTLKHELHYMIFVRAFDEAGNASDTIYTNVFKGITQLLYSLKILLILIYLRMLLGIMILLKLVI